jgi:serine acetyltransferase
MSLDAESEPDPGLTWDDNVRADGVGPFAINDATTITTPDPSFRAMVAAMQADVASFRNHWNEPIVRRFYPGLFIAWSHRLAHTLHIRGLRPLAMMVMWACHALTGCEIRPGAVIGPGLMVVHPSGVVIGGGTIAGARLQLYGGNTFGSNEGQGIHGSPRVGDDAVFAAQAMAIGPVVIGDRVVVGAASVVLKDVASDAKVKGIPAA